MEYQYLEPAHFSQSEQKKVLEEKLGEEYDISKDPLIQENMAVIARLVGKPAAQAFVNLLISQHPQENQKR